MKVDGHLLSTSKYDISHLTQSSSLMPSKRSMCSTNVLTVEISYLIFSIFEPISCIHSFTPKLMTCATHRNGTSLTAHLWAWWNVSGPTIFCHQRKYLMRCQWWYCARTSWDFALSECRGWSYTQHPQHKRFETCQIEWLHPSCSRKINPMHSDDHITTVNAGWSSIRSDRYLSRLLHLSQKKNSEPLLFSPEILQEVCRGC